MIAVRIFDGEPATLSTCRLEALLLQIIHWLCSQYLDSLELKFELGLEEIPTKTLMIPSVPIVYSFHCCAFLLGLPYEILTIQQVMPKNEVSGDYR